MTDPARRLSMLVAIGVLLVCLVACGLWLLDWQPVGMADATRLAVFVTSLCLAGALWLLAVAIVRSGRLPPHTIWLVLGIAAAMRLLTWTAPPILSSDMYRYVWDGRVQLAGINPYRYVPAADQLAFLRDAAVYPNINRAEYAHTVYPPVAQAIFALAAIATPGVFGMKLMIAAFDVLAIVALIRLLRVAGRDPAELLIYAWMPLPVWEFAGNAHIDGAAAGLLALALLIAVRGRSIWTGIVLAAATLTKFLPLVVLPAFFRPRDWRLPAAFVATLVVCYLPYISVGWPVFGFLPDYVSEEGFASGHGIFLLELLGKAMTLPGWAPRAYIVLVVGVLGCLAARFALTTELPAAPGPRALMQARQAVILGGVLLVALSPHYPWYLGWLAPLACLAPLPSVLWMLGAAPLLAHGSFEYLAVPGAVYLPAVILAAVDLCRRLPVPPQALRSVQ
ncbi:MAG: glycosyltransferase 87 family protein [Acetobacteraceae bacterium]